MNIGYFRLRRVNPTDVSDVIYLQIFCGVTTVAVSVYEN